MSISQKERAERYYAFNLEKAKERRHRNKKVIFNFNLDTFNIFYMNKL